jgi:hypothetical protein
MNDQTRPKCRVFLCLSRGAKVSISPALFGHQQHTHLPHRQKFAKIRQKPATFPKVSRNAADTLINVESSKQFLATLFINVN